MKAALIVNRITERKERNFSRMLKYIEQSAKLKTKIIVFPEASLTGLPDTRNPEYDFSLCVEIPGWETEKLSLLSQKYGLYIALGLLEKDCGKIYDTAVLIGPDGKIILKYRRITLGWMEKDADRNIYSCGKEIKVVDTEIGKVTFLICGDLFENSLVSRTREFEPDYVFVPMARAFEDCSYDTEKWKKEKKYYLKQIRKIPATFFVVNYISERDCAFGGAMVVKDGKIIAEKNIGEEGILIADI